MATQLQNIVTKPKAMYFQDEDLYGYVHPIVYNETVKNNQRPVVNTDTSALEKNLHSEEAMQIAAQSLGEDIE